MSVSANFKGPWTCLTTSYVASAANSGSFDKAVNLVQACAVKVLIHCADGAVELSVRSEKGNDVYEVRLDHKKSGDIFAKCNCHDFRRRGGLCKHGAAAMLHLILTAKGTDACTLAAAAHDKATGETASESSRGIATPTRKRPHPDEYQRAECTDPERVPSVPKPSFPQRRSGATDAKSAQESPEKRGSEQKKRSQGLKATLAMRMLQNHVARGNGSAFSFELNRWTGPLEDVQCLLHRAVLGEDERGSLEIVNMILDRSEAAGAVNSARDANGRTLIHASVASQRLELCRMLLQRNADVTIKDSSGLTAMDLAKRRKVDVSNGKWEDPFVMLFQKYQGH